MAKLTIVSAPGISSTDLDKLKEEFDKSIKDKNFPIVTNYNLEIQKIDKPLVEVEQDLIIISAPGINSEDLDKLKEELDKSIKDKCNDSFIVVNYSVEIH